MEQFCMFGIGDCGSKAKTETNIVNNAVTNVLMSSSQNCTASVASSQELVFSDIKTIGCTLNFSDIAQDANITQNFSCAQESAQSADLQAKFKTELESQTEALTKGLFPSPSEAETLTNLRNEVTNNINISSIASCVASAVAAQKQSYGKIEADCRGSDDKSVNFRNIKQKVTMTQVSKCIQGNAQALKATNDFENKLKILTSAKSEGTDLFASLASLGVSLIPAIIGVVLVCVLLSAFMVLTK